MEKAEIDSHTYDIYLDTWNSEQTITKIENQSLFRISHFLVIFISFLVNILHLRNSVLKRETLVKFYDPYIYAPAWGCISPCQRKASRSKKIQYILAIIWNGVFLRVVPNGSPQCVRGGAKRSCYFVKTNDWICSGGLSLIVIQWEPLLIQPFWPILWPKTAQNSHKWSFCGHTPPWRLQTGGSVWIKVGSGLGTSRVMCWDHFPGPEWP